MHLKCRNVNDAFRILVGEIRESSQHRSWPPPVEPPIVRRPSRNGPVLMIDEPVLITYTHPRERVLFNTARDANPFFHLYEALWMLAGRNDVAPLAYYNKRMAEFSDNGTTLNGAYGYRWRKAKTAGLVVNTYRDERDGGGLTGPGTQTNRVVQRVDVDQLDLLVNHLKADPTSRRAVLQMWNVEDDLLKIGPSNVCRRNHKDKEQGDLCLSRGHDLYPYSKDVCCNLSVMFALREEESGPTEVPPMERSMPVIRRRFLDMTVTNRSNDLIWGLIGANYVHFTFLQEYLAARLGVEVGRYHHFTNNLHVYESNWKPDEWLKDRGYPFPEEYSPVPLVSDPAAFDRELVEFVERHSEDNFAGDYTEPFLADVAQPLCVAWHHYKRGDLRSALAVCDTTQVDDWRIAARAWIERRVARRAERGVSASADQE